MTIDLAWKSLDDYERAGIIEYIRTEYVEPHVAICPRCSNELHDTTGRLVYVDHCGGIQHLIDFLRTLGVDLNAY